MTAKKTSIEENKRNKRMRIYNLDGDYSMLMLEVHRGTKMPFAAIYHHGQPIAAVINPQETTDYILDEETQVQMEVSKFTCEKALIANSSWNINFESSKWIIPFFLLGPESFFKVAVNTTKKEPFPVSYDKRFLDGVEAVSEDQLIRALLVNYD